MEFVHDRVFQCLPSLFLVLKPFEMEVSGRDLQREELPHQWPPALISPDCSQDLSRLATQRRGAGGHWRVFVVDGQSRKRSCLFYRRETEAPAGEVLTQTCHSRAGHSPPPASVSPSGKQDEYPDPMRFWGRTTSEDAHAAFTRHGCLVLSPSYDVGGISSPSTRPAWHLPDMPLVLH